MDYTDSPIRILVICVIRRIWNPQHGFGISRACLSNMVMEAKMKTGETVTDLGLYASECCREELIFDGGDTFLRCPRCTRLCEWELEEEIVAQDELEWMNEMAA